MKKNISYRENKYFVHEKNLKLSADWYRTKDITRPPRAIINNEETPLSSSIHSPLLSRRNQGRALP